MSRLAVTVLLALLLAGCGSERGLPPARVSAPPPAIAQPAPVPAPVSAHGAADEAVWHLRAGLNVAVLSCRGPGRTGVAASYTRLLDRHRTLLAAAYAEEQRRHGKGLDRHLTQLYNRFAFQPALARFCARAAEVGAQAAAMDSAKLSGRAGQLLSQLN